MIRSDHSLLPIVMGKKWAGLASIRQI